MKKLICFAVLMLLLFTGCKDKTEHSDNRPKITAEQAEQFTTNMTASHDKAYYTLMGVDQKDDKAVAVVNIFSDEGEYVYSFEAGNVEDFFGVCWEKDTYNIWILTSDKYVECYKHENGKWTLDESQTNVNI